ncbi:MAG: hypothetical protein PF569_02090 [Candidatus Woesearchaeota archaeon]|nr:hypothetical protein [Candidatus Woesearchaeota archaeon]
MVVHDTSHTTLLLLQLIFTYLGYHLLITPHCIFADEAHMNTALSIAISSESIELIILINDLPRNLLFHDSPKK